MAGTKKPKKDEIERTPAQEMRERLFNCQRSRQHTLNLSRLELTEFPNEIQKFSNLKVIDASKNHFVDFLPMAQFRMLEEMDMSRVSHHQAHSLLFKRISCILNITFILNITCSLNLSVLLLFV